MNRERNGKLLTRIGMAVLTASRKWRKRPDGGVVTQRTANPLSRPQIRQSLQNRIAWSRIGFRGASVLIANRPSEGRMNREGERMKRNDPVSRPDAKIIAECALELGDKAFTWREQARRFERALGRITESYPPDTEAGRIAADALAVAKGGMVPEA